MPQQTIWQGAVAKGLVYTLWGSWWGNWEKVCRWVWSSGGGERQEHTEDYCRTGRVWNKMSEWVTVKQGEKSATLSNQLIIIRSFAQTGWYHSLWTASSANVLWQHETSHALYVAGWRVRVWRWHFWVKIWGFTEASLLETLVWR